MLASAAAGGGGKESLEGKAGWKCALHGSARLDWSGPASHVSPFSCSFHLVIFHWKQPHLLKASFREKLTWLELGK